MGVRRSLFPAVITDPLTARPACPTAKDNGNIRLWATVSSTLKTEITIEGDGHVSKILQNKIKEFNTFWKIKIFVHKPFVFEDFIQMLPDGIHEKEAVSLKRRKRDNVIEV